MFKRQLVALKNNPSMTFKDAPIERINRDEENKIIEPIIKKYRKVFRECIEELRDVLELRKNKLEKEEKKENEKQEIIALEVITS